MKTFIYTVVFLIAFCKITNGQDTTNAYATLFIKPSSYIVKIDGKDIGRNNRPLLSRGEHRITVYMPSYEVWDTTVVLTRTLNSFYVPLERSEENSQILFRRKIKVIEKTALLIAPVFLLTANIPRCITRHENYLKTYQSLQESTGIYDKASSRAEVSAAKAEIKTRKDAFADAKKKYTQSCIMLAAASGISAFMIYKGLVIRLPKYSETAKIAFDAISFNQTSYPCLKLQASF